ncbi:hypothetical protein AX16_000987 [Volvariella volvacea WC 439]|nr:hypothetical protein AX16_000987 [Volvariella volvacea WC 439]
MSLSSPIRPNISDTPELPTFDEMMASLRGSRELEDSSQQSPSTSQNSPASSRSKESVELQLIQRSADGSSDDGSDVGLQKRDALSLDPQIRGTTIPSVPMPSAAVIERLPPVHVIQPPGQMPRLSTYTFNLSPVRQAWYQPPRFTKRARTMASPHLADHSSTPPRVGQPEVESKVAAEGGLQQSQGSTQSYSQIGTFSMLQTQAPYESPRFSQ